MRRVTISKMIPINIALHTLSVNKDRRPEKNYVQNVDEKQTRSDVASSDQLVKVVDRVRSESMQVCVYVAFVPSPNNGDTSRVEHTRVQTLLQCSGCPVFYAIAVGSDAIVDLPFRRTAFIHQSHR